MFIIKGKQKKEFKWKNRAFLGISFDFLIVLGILAKLEKIGFSGILRSLDSLTVIIIKTTGAYQIRLSNGT